MTEQPPHTPLNKIGEFGFIEMVKANTQIYHADTVQGIGDDAAVMDIGKEEYLLVSTDMLLEGIHFDLSYVPLKHLGYKAVVVNLSDIAAMNGIPKQITVSIGVSSRFSLEALQELYRGIEAACENYTIDLVGGDTTTSQAGLVISITAIGYVKKEKIAYRNRAKVGDLICVTGDLGGAYMGLQVLAREKQAFLSNPEMQPELEGKNYVIQRQLKPEARLDMVHELQELGIIPTAMIDLSDGLASDLLHICKASQVGAYIYEDKLPIDPQTLEIANEDFKINPLVSVLNGGEDYELLFTIQQTDFEKLKNHADIHIIGHIVDKNQGTQLITPAGNGIAIQAQGWVHF